MIAIVEYNAGNIRSVINALERLGREAIATDDEALIRQAEKVILPGVGEAASAMQYLREKGLDRLLPTLEQPVLGICLGLQLMCRFSEEGTTTGMSIFDTVVRRFPPGARVPHMGWNNLQQQEGPLFAGVDAEADVYFVHSYYAACCADTIAVCDYQLSFSAALQKNNFYAAQFHPEKSAGAGAAILKNFLSL
ncbi:imidazole glycerol phosphate synthase subunit HisH [Taibaiella koreensis]|uniref:imidazole glycerol phosphate synthase subunit HisH n=1 Tax=Taibaiella koreensis TaxID=1268548 RepID=UPI000E59BA58|nr:imidazole glycerol phosphate synthase subunit HisH [Taibaiella koreensis]